MASSPLARPLSSTFMPKDKLSITLTFKGDVAIKTGGLLWLNVDKNNFPTTNGSRGGRPNPAQSRKNCGKPGFQIVP
jgi:hypothetical protein